MELKRISRDKGFSMVELMIVVSIIGVLASVSVPMFKKYMAKSKTSEAKVQLAAAYTSLHSFFAEFDMYHTCLKYMGFNPAAEIESRFYAVGFDSEAEGVSFDSNVHQNAVFSGMSDSECPLASVSVANQTYFESGKGHGGLTVDKAAFDASGSSSIGNQSTGAQTFNVLAVGIISADHVSTSENSVFIINEDKVISNLRTGY